MDELKRLLRRTDAPNELSYHTGRELRCILVQEAWIMEALDHKDAANKDEDIDIEDEDSMLHWD